MHRSLKARLAAAPIAYCALIIAAHAQTFHSNTIDSDASTIFRDYNTDGVSGSGAFNPHKSDFRNWGKALGSAVRVITPQNYGAACDGVTDDTTALQAWASAVNGSFAFTGQGVVGYIPAGTCVFKSPLTFGTGNGAAVRGEGLASVLLYAGASTTATPLNFGTTTGGCSIQSWRIGGFLLASSTLMTAGDAMVVNDGCGIDIDIAIENNAGGAYGNWWQGLEIKGGNQIHLENYVLTGQNIALLMEGDTAAHSSTQLTDPRIGKGIIAGATYGIDIAGNVGGAVIDGPDALANGTSLRISRDFVALPNNQIAIGSQTFLDATSGGAGRGIDIQDAGGTTSILKMTGGWIASTGAECVNVVAAAQWVIDWHGGQMINCGTDGLKNNSTNLTANIVGVSVGRMAGYLGFSGYAFNCAVANVNVHEENINFLSAVGTANFSSNCNPQSYTVPGQSTVFSGAPLAPYLSPTVAWQYDVTNQVATTIANGANAALPAGSGMITVSEATGGSTATYNCGGGACVLLGASTSTWVASTSSPAGGKMSVAYNGSTAYAVYNNSGASDGVNISLIRTKATN